MTDTLFTARDNCEAAMIQAEIDGTKRTRAEWGNLFGIEPDTAYQIAYRLKLHKTVICRPPVRPYDCEHIISPMKRTNRTGGKEYEQVFVRLGKRDLVGVGDPPYAVRRVGNSLVITSATSTDISTQEI